MPDPILPPFRGHWLTPREAVDRAYDEILSQSIFPRLREVEGMLRRKTFDPDELEWVDFRLKMLDRILRARDEKGGGEDDD